MFASVDILLHSILQAIAASILHDEYSSIPLPLPAPLILLFLEPPIILFGNPQQLFLLLESLIFKSLQVMCGDVVEHFVQSDVGKYCFADFELEGDYAAFKDAVDDCCAAWSVVGGLDR